MPDEDEKGYHVIVIWFLGAGPDLFLKEPGAKGSKPDHAIDVWFGFLVPFWIKGVFAIEKLHDSGGEVVELCGDGRLER